MKFFSRKTSAPQQQPKQSQAEPPKNQAPDPRHHNLTPWQGLGIAPAILGAIQRLAFKEPTPIQHQAIPLGIEGKDLIALAQTGTGKTLAFGIPIIQRLARIKGRALILTPTRELALQIEESFRPVAESLGVRCAVVIGGASMEQQKRDLSGKSRVIIATPGRLVDHLEQKTVTLRDVCILTLDEADRMLDMGFAPQLNRIMSAVPDERQTLLFSATMPPEILELAKREMHLPLHIEVAPSGTAPEKVEQEIYFVEKMEKLPLLHTLLNQYRGSILVFSRTKHGAHKLASKAKSWGHAASEIHSDRTLPQRRKALEGFKAGVHRVLFATDIAARGIDVSGIQLVINYDLPSTSDDYVHRIGRTGRAGLAGRAITFATFDQQRDVQQIERMIRSNLPVTEVPPLPVFELPPTRLYPPPRESRKTAPPQEVVPDGFQHRRGKSSRRRAPR